MLHSVRKAGTDESPLPAAVKGEVRRERLLSRLTAAMDGPWTLTLVSAPAGSGKTRLLSQWAQGLRADPGIDLVWVSLERGEPDLPLLRSALGRIDDPDLQEALAAVPAVHSAATARALARALREAKNRIVFIIDDVHRVEDEHTAQLISTFVQSAPGTVHVVLAGRGTRAIPLARRRIAGVALELDARALAFTPAEVRAFFGARGLRLSQGEVSTVLARTEGWATGLQLMMLDAAGAQSVLGPALRGDAPEVADYFVEEVLGDLEGELRSFLEATAVVDRFTPELAAVLSETGSVTAMIDRLLRLNVLAGPDAADPSHYHYPPLLREFLLGRLRQGGADREEQLHRRAADWFAQEGQPLLALQHAVRGGEAACTAGVLRRCGMQLVLDGRADEVRQLIAQLPATLRAVPTVRMLVAAAELSCGDVIVPPVGAGESDADRRWRCGIELHTALRRGGIAEALDGAGAHLHDLGGEEQLDTYALLETATAELYVGRLDQAEATARLAGDLARAIGARAAELQAEAVLATSVLFRGRLRDAIEAGAALERRWHEFGEPDSPFFEVTRVWRFWGPYEGMQILEEAQTLGVRGAGDRRWW